MRPVRFDPALGDVAEEQVGAALIAEFPDLPQQLLDRDRGVFGAALAQVITVGIDQRGPVLRGARTSRSGSVARAYRLTVFSDRPSRREHSSRPVPLPSRSWTSRHRPAVVPARLPSFTGGPAAAQHEACAATSLWTASARPCHRCHRSPAWTAPGTARRAASA